MATFFIAAALTNTIKRIFAGLVFAEIAVIGKFDFAAAAATFVFAAFDLGKIPSKPLFLSGIGDNRWDLVAPEARNILYAVLNIKLLLYL